MSADVFRPLAVKRGRLPRRPYVAVIEHTRFAPGLPADGLRRASQVLPFAFETPEAALACAILNVAPLLAESAYD